MKDQELIFQIKNNEVALEAGIYKVIRSQRLSPEGKEGDFYVIHAPDWVNVIPLLKDEKGQDCFLMVKQFRHGSEKLTLEFPGGMVDAGENPMEAANRELREETGYSAKKLKKLGHINPNPAFMNNQAHTYLATELQPLHKQELDDNERIHFFLIPVQEVRDSMGSGLYDHGIMLMALWWYDRQNHTS